MTTLAPPTIYDRALSGEPIPQIVRSHPPVRTSSDGLWTVGEWLIRIPNQDTSSAPEVHRFVSEIRNRTGWSARRLAEIVGTSHTTILRIENGGRLVTGHSGELRRRLSQAEDVVARIYVIAGRDQETTARLLEEAAPPSGRSAVDFLQSDEPARAYLAAIDVARPRPPGLLVGTRPRRNAATAPLHE
jgi:transcriptional regulator with XRE-family HTH domain